MRSVKNKIINKKGTAVTEFAMVLPILIISLCIIITGGQMMINKCVLNYAASEAARKACVQDSLDNAKDIAESTAKKIVNEGVGMTFNGVSIYGPNWEKGHTVTISVSGNFDVVFPLIDAEGKWSNHKTVSATKSMIIEKISNSRLGY